MNKTILALSTLTLMFTTGLQAKEATLDNVVTDFADQPTKETDWYMTRLQKKCQLIPISTIASHRAKSTSSLFVKTKTRCTAMQYLTSLNRQPLPCLSTMNMPLFR